MKKRSLIAFVLLFALVFGLIGFMDDFIKVASTMDEDIIYLTEISSKLHEGQTVKVKVIGISPDGKINLSIKKA